MRIQVNGLFGHLSTSELLITDSGGINFHMFKFYFFSGNICYHLLIIGVYFHVNSLLVVISWAIK